MDFRKTPIGDAIFILNAVNRSQSPRKKQATALENMVFPAIAFSFCFGNFCEFFAKYYVIRSRFARRERGRILCM